MKKHIAACLLICMITVLLCSCGKDDTIPDGMQACRDSDVLGLTMYAPEGWTVCNVGDISAAYVSSINQTSVSLVESDMGDAADFTAYFQEHKNEFPYEIELTSAGAEVTLGNADSASSFVYTFTYGERSFKALQVLALYGERFYIFTYTSYDEAYSDESTYYETYYDRAKEVMSTLVFRQIASDVPEEVSPQEDAQGYKLVADRKVNGFYFYMAPTWVCDENAGIVRIGTNDGSSVIMTEATGSGMSVRTYFLHRLTELSAFVEDIQVYVDGEALPFPEDEQTQISEAYKDMIIASSFGDAKQAAECMYSFTYQGQEYRVLQYLTTAGNHGFVFTYTAPANVFDTHLDEVKAMAQKVRFSR